jgi:hypothetical protein
LFPSLLGDERRVRGVSDNRTAPISGDSKRI